MWSFKRKKSAIHLRCPYPGCGKPIEDHNDDVGTTFFESGWSVGKGGVMRYGTILVICCPLRCFEIRENAAHGIFYDGDGTK